MEASVELIANTINTGVTIFYLAIMVFVIIGMWKMFTKAGEPGWAAIVPFYGRYKLYKMSWGTGWLFLLELVPCVNVVVQIIMNIKLAKAFGKGTGFAIGLIFLAPIFYMILGFDDSSYYGPQP